MRSALLRTVVNGSLTLLFVASFGIEARAEERGIFGRSGRTPGLTCADARCHGAGVGGSSVAFTVTPINPDLPPFSLGYVPGARYSVNVSVSGGPAMRFGFNWESDAGSTFAMDMFSKKNNQLSHPAEMAHTLDGARSNSWSFGWNAPADRRTVNIFLMGNSGNGNRRDSFDAPTTPVTARVTAVPVEILARIGNVNDTPGDPVPVLFVNGSRGDDSRVVNVQTEGPSMEVSIASYPGAPGAIPYVLYAIRRANRAGDETAIPDVGQSSFAFPVAGGTPMVIANTLGHEPQLGTPRLASTPLGPGAIFTLPQVRPRFAGVSVTLQGLVPDGTSASGAAVTNAVVVTFL